MSALRYDKPIGEGHASAKKKRTLCLLLAQFLGKGILQASLEKTNFVGGTEEKEAGASETS